MTVPQPQLFASAVCVRCGLPAASLCPECKKRLCVRCQIRPHGCESIGAWADRMTRGDDW